MDYSLISVKHFNYESNHTTPVHQHPYYEIKIYWKGNGYNTVDKTTVPFSPYTITFVAPNHPHSEKFLISGEFLCLRLWAAPAAFFPSELILNPDPNHIIFTYIRQMEKETRERKSMHHDINNLLLNVCFHEFKRLFPSNPDPYYQSLYKAKEYLEKNYYQKQTLQELSKNSTYDYDYFRHVFKKLFGYSPQGYLTRIRLENARTLLVEHPNMNITQIADSCGFFDSSQFSTIFKKQFGLPPKQYRKLYWNSKVK